MAKLKDKGWYQPAPDEKVFVGNQSSELSAKGIDAAPKKAVKNGDKRGRQS